MKFICVILPILLLLTSSILLINAYDVKIWVANNATDAEARQRWDTEFGKAYVVGLFKKEIIPFIWRTFNQPTDADRRIIPAMGVVVKPLPPDSMAEIGENNIYINQQTIVEFPKDPDRAKFEFKSLMYHEGTHIFQWNGEGSCPGGLTEGIADYMRAKAGLYDESFYPKPGEGSKWDEGYGITERFLEYCDSLKPRFTATLNNKMRKVFKEDYFEELIGKSVNQLWREYKKKYGNGNNGTMKSLWE